MNKQQMKDELHKGLRVVTFTKADGSTRVMAATLNAELIGTFDEVTDESTEPKLSTEPKRKVVMEPDHLIRVFDLEAKGWRSFKVESVISFE